MKTYKSGEIIYHEGERMDQLNVVLEGHVINHDCTDNDYHDHDNGESEALYILRQDEILALEEIPDTRLSNNDNIKFKPIYL